LLKEAANAATRQVEYSGKFNQNQKFIKFKVGGINFDELKEANFSLSNHMSISNKTTKESYSIVLAQAFVGNAESYLIDEDPDKFNDFKFNSADKVDCYYLVKNSNYENRDIKANHWYILREPKKLVYLAYVRFTTDTDDIKCSGCSSSNRDMKYCHNDNKYFCYDCDEEYHTKSVYSVLRKHKRINYLSFSITYASSCYDHNLKPYEFYCFKCKAVYCIKCLTDGDHKTNTDHEVKYLNDVFNSFDQEVKAVSKFI
jgi:hypothetical protein